MAVTKSLVFITCLCFARDLVFCDDYEEIGKDITLTPSIRGKPTDIRWKHNGDVVLWYDGSEVQESGPFRRRVLVDFETGQLTVRRLTSRDSGQYQSEITINGKLQTSSHTVTVLDVLPEPRVTCEPDDTVMKLLCSVDSRTQVSYGWSGPSVKAQLGPELVVEDLEENRDAVYTCTVENQAHSRSTAFTLTDCHTGRAGAGTAVFVPVIIVVILLIILLILLGGFLYRRREKSRQSGLKNMDPEHGEGHNLLRNDQKDVMPGSSQATLPSHARLPPQNQSIINKKWDQDNGAESSGEPDEGQTLLKETSKTLKQSPQSSVSETNQEDTANGDVDSNVKNSKHAVEAEEKTFSKPDDTEKERPKPREDEEKDKSQKQESEFLEHQNETEETKTEDNSEDNKMPGQKEEREDKDTETVSPQSAVTERNQEDTANGNEGDLDKNKKKSQSDGERSAEPQNESMRNHTTKDATNAEDDRRPGAKEEENQDGIDRANTADACAHPAEDQLMDGDLSSPADSPANPEKNPINSSDLTSNQTGRSNNTDQDEEERKRPGQEQEQTTEEKNHDPETQSCKLTDSELSRHEEVQTKTLKQSPQSSVSETNQEDTANGNVDSNVKNSKHAVEAEEKTFSKLNDTEERPKPREEEEKSQKQESGNEEEFLERQNEREETKTEDNSEDNQTPRPGAVLGFYKWGGTGWTKNQSGGAHGKSARKFN